MTTEVQIDWIATPSKSDVLKSVLRQIGAPEWHGVGLDALEDSLVGGDINEAKPPYKFEIRNFSIEGEELKAFQNDLIEICLECVRKHDGTTISVK